MTDINTYRCRIGLFCPTLRKNNFLNKTEYYSKFTGNNDQSGRKTLSILQFIFKLVLCLGLLQPACIETQTYRIAGSPGHHTSTTQCWLSGSVHRVQGGVCGGQSHAGTVGWSGVGCSGGEQYIQGGEYSTSIEIINHNFQARYLNGNIQKKKGILNMHLNIRSLRHKVYEVKQIIKENNPTLLGLSECEIYKDRVDEKLLKIPGYNILFPKSWDKHGFARVVVYVKKTFKYEQILDLEDDRVQSIWMKGCQRNSKELFFCHGYREHLTGQGVAAQRDYLATFLGQWEEATLYGGRTEPNEIHVCGDMNIDVYQDRWLHHDYHLVTLSRLIKTVCDVNNFHQLDKDITRLQFNSVSNSTSMSTIDHIYTNAKFRCSDVQVISFGDSDHDIISYTRYSKNPPVPARIILKRSYKNFDRSAFLADVAKTDWAEVLGCNDVDEATECFTRKFRYVLNVHAPWSRIQQRKTFCPWLTAETKDIMKQRDSWKQSAKDLALLSQAACPAQIHAWNQYKKLRNQVNNRKKSEENNYKSNRISEVADSPDLV